MELAVDVSGTGDRVAVLVHGIMSDGRTWHRVAADLRDRGYRVVTVDLAGHGRSPRAAIYAPSTWADDVVETVAPLLSSPPHLVVGHSLGALVTSLAAERLTPRRLVYLDPAFAFPRGAIGVSYKQFFALTPKPRRSVLRRLNPRWTSADLDREMTALHHWDRRTLFALARSAALTIPTSLVAPSLAILADHSLLIPPRIATHLSELGMTVQTLRGTGHNVFRDDHDGVMRLIDSWMSSEGAEQLAQTERRTATTLPSTSASSPRIGSNAELRGNSQV
jgi:pimeloyl-ACP methyl ester carboxylesterase